MTPKIQEIWVYLSASPLLWLALTLLAFEAAKQLHQRCNEHPLTHPLLLSIGSLAAVLVWSDTPYAVYFEGAKFVHFLLGPATVALAIPLYAQWPRLKRMVGPLLLTLCVGSVMAAGLAVWVARVCGASSATVLSLAPKSVTTPIAMAIAEKIGGLPALAAVLVILTGMLGVVVGPRLLRLARITDPAAQGFALGLTAHGIGTSRALQLDATAGAFAALAMGLNALATALWLPLVVRLLS